MNPTAYLLFTAALTLASKCSALSDSGRTTLIDKLAMVESGGRPAAVGDGGKALGLLQIHAEMVRDANRISGKSYTHSEMLDPQKAREVAYTVLTHYDKHIARTTGKPASARQLAYIWNGGGGAWRRALAPKNDSKQAALERYWGKVSS